MAMLTLQASDELLADLDTIAQDQSREAGGWVSRSAVVRQALREFRDKHLALERRARAATRQPEPAAA